MAPTDSLLTLAAQLPFPVLTSRREYELACAWPDRRDPPEPGETLGRPSPGTLQGLEFYLRDHGAACLLSPPGQTPLERGTDLWTLQADVLASSEAQARAAGRQLRAALCGQAGRRPGRWQFAGADLQLMEDDRAARLVMTYTTTHYESGLALD